jgi:hypothetical protein
MALKGKFELRLWWQLFLAEIGASSVHVTGSCRFGGELGHVDH